MFGSHLLNSNNKKLYHIFSEISKHGSYLVLGGEDLKIS